MAVIVFVAVAAGVCLALGYWQWDRYESASGTGQNLGYALQWPLFAAFCVYGYRRFVKLEDQQAEIAEQDADGGDTDAGSAAPVRRPEVPDAGPGRLQRLLGRSGSPAAVTEIPENLLPQRPAPGPAPGGSSAEGRSCGEQDRSLSEYNDYLAQLDERTTKGRGR